MKNTKKGFTLVELLVVIAILAILASVAVVGYTAFLKKAEDSKQASELHQITTAIEAELMVSDVVQVAANIYVYKTNDGMHISETAPTKCEDLSANFTGDLALSMNADGDLVYGDNVVVYENVDHTNGAVATCTTAQTCTVCGEVLVEALGHDMVTDEAVAPTCTTTGLTEGSHCSRCDHKVAQETVDVLDHVDVPDDTDHNCDVCGAEGVTEHVDADGDTACDNGCGVEIPAESEEQP